MKKLNKHTNTSVTFHSHKTKVIYSPRVSTEASSWSTSPMASLLRLQSVKNNPTFHTLDYSGALSVRQEISSARIQSPTPKEPLVATPTNTTSTKRMFKIQRSVSKKDQRTRPQSQIHFNDYQLDPTNLYTGQPKRTTQKNLPPEKRQLIVEEYITNSQNPAPVKTNLDLLWHQTLNEHTQPEEHHNHSDPKLLSLAEKFRSIPVDQSPLLTPKNVKSMSMKFNSGSLAPTTLTHGGGSFVGGSEEVNLNRPPPSPKLRRGEFDFSIKKVEDNITPRGPENIQAFRNLELLSSFIKDFLKITQHTFKAKDEINPEQRALHHFILTFAKEIEFAEKLPTKEANKERLRTFQNLIESRLNDIFTKQELLIEQIQKIQAFDPSLESGSERQELEILTVTSNFDLNTANTRLSQAHSIQNNPSNMMGLVDNIDTVKDEVQKLQSERRQFYEKKYRKSDFQFRPSTAYRTTTKFSDDPQENDFKELASCLAMLPRLQSQPSIHSAHDLTKMKTTSSQNWPKVAGIDDLDEPANKKASQEHVKLFSTLSVEENEKVEQDDLEAVEERQAHKEMQIFFTSGLDQLESHFTKCMRDLKVFIRDIDAGRRRRDTLQNTKMTHLRAMVCIDSLNEICLKLIKEHESKKKHFLENVKQYLHLLEKVVQANVLKINSLRNLVAMSTKKLYEIQKMRKKVNPLDLRDKLYRKNFELKFGQMKEALKKDREAILFIANQVAEKLPNQKESKDSILIEFLESLQARSIKLLRGAHLVARLGSIEEDYTARIDHALDAIDRIHDHVERLVTKPQKNIVIKAATIEEAEELQKEIDAIGSKIKIMRKELLYYREYSFFTGLIIKPVDTLATLIQRLANSQNLLKNSLMRVRSEVLHSYNVKANNFVALKVKLDNFVQEDLISKKGYLDFDLYEKHKTQIETFESELEALQTDIEEYVTEKYPPSVTMLPKPEDQLEAIKALSQQVETLSKIIGTGALFNSACLSALLDGATTATLRDQFEIIRESVIKEIREKELIGGSPLSSPQCQEMCNKILQLLITLRQLIKQAFECNDKCNMYLSDFATNYYDNKEDFEPLFYQLLYNLKNAYDEYQAVPIDETTRDHKVIVQINNRLKAIRQGEESLLQGLMTNFRLVKDNQDYFEIEIEPIAVPCNYLNMLNKWAEKHNNAKIVRERMRPVFDNLVEFRKSEYIPPNLKSIVEDFIYTQEKILNSIEVCISFFEVGNVLSEKRIKDNLTSKIRTDRTDFGEFLSDFEEFMSTQKIKAEQSKGRVTEQFEFFLTSIMPILTDLLQFLKIIDERYTSIPHDLERVREMNPKDRVAIIRTAANTLQELEVNFIGRIESFEKRLVKKCTMIQAIRDFVEQKLVKEVRIYNKLCHEVQQMQEFTEMIKREFLMNELPQLKFRQLKSLSTDGIEKKRMICRNYISHLSNYLSCEEINERQVVHDVLSRRRSVFVQLDKILTLFRDFYEQGKDYWIQIDQVLTKPVELSVLSKDLEKLGAVLSKIAKKVKDNYDSIDNLKLIEEEISAVSLKNFVVHDIYEFLIQSRKWTISLRRKIDGMKEFDLMVKENFNGRVFLLREDWLLSLKECLPALDEAPIGIKGIKLDYEGLIDRMEEFTNVIKEKYVDLKEKAISNVKKYVILLNTKFLNEQFFRAEKSEKVDKITPKLFRLAEKMRERRIQIPNTIRRLSNYCSLLAEVLEAVDFLSNKENLNLAGFNEIDSMDVVIKYINDFGLHQWREVLKLLSEKGHSMVMNIKEENQWLRIMESSLNGPIFGKQIDMIKGYWLIHHD